MKKFTDIFENEHGGALLATMITLLALTVIGVAASRMTTMENSGSGNQKRKQAAFYAAEAGLEHGKNIISRMVVEKGSFSNWTFILDGTSKLPGSGAALDAADDTNFTDGVPLLSDISFFDGKYKYNVRIWNNSEEADPETDTDKTIIMRSQAEGLNGEFAAVEISLGAGFAEGGTRISETDSAQEGAGGSKNYTSDDRYDVKTTIADGSISYQI